MAADAPARPRPSVEESLAWEAQWAPRAAIVAILAGIATIAGTIIANTAFRGRPQVTLADGLRDLADPDNPRGLLEPLLLHIDEHMPAFIGGQIVTALAAPLAALALIYLFRAAQARNHALGRGALVALVVGGVAGLIGGVVGPASIALSISDFVGSSDHTTQAAHDALQPSAALTAQLVAFIGRVSLGLGLVLVALNAMRVGLLTRFMGILGIMAGAFMAFPFIQLPIVQAFWLVAVGVMFLGKLPNTPPAWETGRAEPWPTRQQMLEEKGAAARADGAPSKLPPPPAADAEPERPAHVRSKKKKRRR